MLFSFVSGFWQDPGISESQLNTGHGHPAGIKSLHVAPYIFGYFYQNFRQIKKYFQPKYMIDEKIVFDHEQNFRTKSDVFYILRR